ncbi:MAG: RodZ domain-containing protein [Kiloniellaceae bacterium]
MAHPLKKSEHKREEPKLGEPKLVHSDSASEISIAQELIGERVADTLIRARQQVGQDLRSIAEVLCIRYSYLDAIERGQYENLPGPTYAMGFVRTYAEYLGLDGDQIVDRFKHEVQGIDSQTKLHFPTPAPEGKMPGGAVFLVAALLFAGAYGVWFYLSNKGESLGDLVAPVPAQLQELVEGSAPPAESASPAAPASAVPAPDASSTAAEQPPEAQAVTREAETGAAAPGPAQPRAASDDTPATPTMTPQNEAPASVGAAPQAPATVESPAAPGSAAPTGDVAHRQPGLQPAEPAATQPAPSTPAANPQSAVSAPEASAPASTAAEAPAAEPPASESAAARSEPYSIPAAPESNPSAATFLLNHQPTVYGDENSDARIVLKASQDAWVQVRDREGNLLLTRVLRVGDSYMVPNQADLTLLTGNAGGLEISVDGSALPALGPVGAVRRNIPLDPEALRGGAGSQP